MAAARRGRRVVLVVAAVTVGVAAGLGFLVGLVAPGILRPVRLFGVWTVEPTPVGLALYGATTVGGLLAVGLGLVVLVSRYAGGDSRGR